MKSIKFILFGLAILVNVSCDKDSEIGVIEFDYLIFGHFYGECGGEECVETFKLTSEKLFEDTKDIYLGADFNFIELGNDLFEQVKDLTDFFPNELLNDETSTFGCPDCADGGGLFIQYAEDENIKTWIIDQSQDEVPKYLHDFMDAVNEKIDIINN